ncbi:8-oxo-dGTP diphosphatase [Natronobacillus azotifigens]|uniref:8-oxo-dGTP diphosphatase n=1 Tax=Natronobacillus azotifigens TaxID=472978 RepID=A0A9J6RCT9_9BACI|nr:8-oxo-dGTP diphosphatase [Natronobacillus azotifigens]MCZ0703325.1 8-oxo-dGTP diphosphatase [Natronobacillus azotifigens]
MKRVDFLQRVTNCLLRDKDKVLLLKKPKHGWYAMPGGKMEPGESIQEAVIREFREETNLHIVDPALYSVSTMVQHKESGEKNEWMMFTFLCEKSKGNLTDFCREGELEWVELSAISTLPVAPSDRHIHDYVLQRKQSLYASFELDENDQLIDYRLN